MMNFPARSMLALLCAALRIPSLAVEDTYDKNYRPLHALFENTRPH